MVVYTGTELMKYVTTVARPDYKERFLLKDVTEYLCSNEPRVACLYGLRRTGKTVMMCQTIKNLNAETCILIECEYGDKMHDVRQVLQEHSNCSHIFIDEATKMTDFIDTGSFLANHVAAVGKKVILAGTDTLGFLLAKANELYDRAVFIHTTYIPYKEYRFLLGKDFRSYLQYGGTLTDGWVFYNKDSTAEYTNTAIVYNIIHGLERWNRGVNYGTQILADIINKNELPSFINKVLEYPDRQFVAEIINAAFKSHDLGSLQDLMMRHNMANPESLDVLHDRIRIFLGIKEPHYNKADEKSVRIIVDYLKKMDVLYQIPGTEEYIFTQPGMRYSQAINIAEALVTSDVFSGFSKEEQDGILKKLDADICGRMMEDIVFYELSKQYPELHVSKYRNAFGNEIDVILTDFVNKKSVALEIKYSDKADTRQIRHLTNAEFLQEVQECTGIGVTKKVVVYRGESIKSEIPYINVEDLLCNVNTIRTLFADELKTISIAKNHSV